MKNELTTLYCSECGGTNIQVMAWVDPNTGEYIQDVNIPFENDDCWCDDCEDHTQLLTLKELWERFANTPVNNNDEIEAPFLMFPVGTPKTEVWHWFDDRCPNNLHDDLLYSENNPVLTFKQFMAETGYDLKTTFWDDFSIADRFGIGAVQDTFNRAFKEWKHDHIFLTELVMVLNHKMWQHYETNEPLARLYDKLWKQADQYACENLKGDELDYFYRITD